MQDHIPLERIPGRKTPATGVKLFFGQPTIIFVTVCAKDRVPWIARKEVQTALETIWRKADTWLVGDYLLMPDHLHLFCAPRDLRFSIEKWVTFWKRDFSRKHTDCSGEWQRNAFHHRLRNEREYGVKWQYVSENPIRAGLVENPNDWPYRGKIHQLSW